MRQRSRTARRPAKPGARAMAALEESAFSCCSATRSQHPDGRQAARADLLAQSAGGRSLNVVSAVRLAIPSVPPASDVSRWSRCWCSGLGIGAATTVFTVVDSVVLRPLPYAATRSARHVVGHEHREGSRARSDLAGEFHGLSRAAGVQGRGRVVAPERQSGRSGTRSRARQHDRSHRATCSKCSASAAIGDRVSDRRSALRRQRADLRDQRPAVAHALQRRSVDHRPAAVC